MLIFKFFSEGITRFQTGRKEFNDDMDIIHSDTLFSAIINCYLLIYGKTSVEEFIDEFRKQRITISSMFYFIDVIKNKRTSSVYFFPIPFFKHVPTLEEKYYSDYRFVSFKLFNELVSNFNFERETTNFDSNIKTISDEFLCSVSEIPNDTTFNLKSRVLESKIALNQSRLPYSRLQTFIEEDLSFPAINISNYKVNRGFFFLAEMNSSEFYEKFISSLRLLCDEGIGGKRSLGNGVFSHFTSEDFKYDNKLFDDAGCKINLSLLSPNSNEVKTLETNIIRYLSIVRGGWTSNNLKTKNVRMIREGSLFNKKLKGHLVNITPSKFAKHKIYRNGNGFFL